jgi:septal ring factor EnvC (AmiA/AmiB activator)
VRVRGAAHGFEAVAVVRVTHRRGRRYSKTELADVFSRYETRIDTLETENAQLRRQIGGLLDKVAAQNRQLSDADRDMQRIDEQARATAKAVYEYVEDTERILHPSSHCVGGPKGNGGTARAAVLRLVVTEAPPATSEGTAS